MTAAFMNPVADLQQYDPRYKVEVLLNESMLTNFKRGNAVDPTIEVTALCAQLDFLCLKEMELQDRRGTTNEKKPLSRTPSGQISNAFETKAMILIDRMENVLCRSAYCQYQLIDYLDHLGLQGIYPRALELISLPKAVPTTTRSQCSLMSDHITVLCKLNQVVNMAHQLNSDIANITNHKYVAHQIALLYQSICTNSLKKCTFLQPYQKSIEDNFKHVKNTINSSGDTPHVTQQQKQWLLDLTSGIVNTAVSQLRSIIPPDIAMVTRPTK